jgi:hypothetical protein
MSTARCGICGARHIPLGHMASSTRYFFAVAVTVIVLTMNSVTVTLIANDRKS